MKNNNGKAHYSSTFDIFPGLRLNQTSLIDKILIDRVSVY